MAAMLYGTAAVRTRRCHCRHSVQRVSHAHSHYSRQHSRPHVLLPPAPATPCGCSPAHSQILTLRCYTALLADAATARPRKAAIAAGAGGGAASMRTRSTLRAVSHRPAHRPFPLARMCSAAPPGGPERGTVPSCPALSTQRTRWEMAAAAASQNAPGKMEPPPAAAPAAAAAPPAPNGAAGAGGPPPKR